MLDYNSRLKPMGQKGLCGDPEIVEVDTDLRRKVSSLTSLIRNSNKCVIFTGAGISTSSGIPDFRGPKGIWTRELKGDTIPDEERTSLIFDSAIPSFTHYAIFSLMQRGFVHHVISQNVDGLHLRSGVPPSSLSELHGNIFIEICETCGKQYFRDKDVGGMGMNYTGNICEDNNCKGKLIDFAVDWDTELPKQVFHEAYKQVRSADLCICLGTSLRIRPAGNMPRSVLRPNKQRNYRGKLVIVNLQKTHLDQECSLRIFGYSDQVMEMLCDKLGIFVDVPIFVPKRELNVLEKEDDDSKGVETGETVVAAEQRDEDEHEIKRRKILPESLYSQENEIGALLLPYMDQIDA
jgi:NAD+-dependent protein deacetylase sirtuin 6